MPSQTKEGFQSSKLEDVGGLGHLGLRAQQDFRLKGSSFSRRVSQRVLSTKYVRRKMQTVGSMPDHLATCCCLLVVLLVLMLLYPARFCSIQNKVSFLLDHRELCSGLGLVAKRFL